MHEYIYGSVDKLGTLNNSVSHGRHASSTLPPCRYEQIENTPGKSTDDFIYRVTNLSVPKTAGTWRDTTFGVAAYKTPVRDEFRPRIKHFTTNKENYKCFTDLHSSLYKVNPGPSHKTYDIVWDWRKTSMWRTGAFDKHSGPFLKKPKSTFTEEVMAISKKLPAPNKYLTTNYGHMKTRTLGNYRQ